MWTPRNSLAILCILRIVTAQLPDFLLELFPPVDRSLAPNRRLPTWKDSFPPRELVLNVTDPLNGARVADWLVANQPAMKAPDPSLTKREKELVLMSAHEYINARRSGRTTCKEYAAALVKRMVYYKYMNQFMYWDNMPHQVEYVLTQAARLDSKAEIEGIESIAPLYGLLVPAKGTMATTDFPSSAGTGVLHNYYATTDAAAVALLRQAHGIVMGKTNVPEFADGLITANYANGRTFNPYDHSLTTGGSSGGSASAVATYITPVAFSEDTGGSTRHPAYQCHNFGYDPSHMHYPNAGNPGLEYFYDQVGLNARNLSDILLVDAALLRTHKQHEEAARDSPAAHEIRLGLPRYPFVETCDSSSGCLRVAKSIEFKYEAAKRALMKGGVSLVEGEWNNKEAVFKEELWDSYYFSQNGPSAAVWASIYLSTNVTNDLINADLMPMGKGHHPHIRPFNLTDSHTYSEIVMKRRPEVVNLWNSYFDLHEVDLIMTPPQRAIISYADSAAATVPVLKSKCKDCPYITVNATVEEGAPFYSMFKSIPIPKLMVPTGLDEEGRPTAVLLWGRAVPVAEVDNVTCAKTYDLDFLYKSRTLVELIHRTPGLMRVHAPLVEDLFQNEAAEPTLIV